MLQSMTGFGKGESQNNELRVVVEIKSVNNRFKDFRFKMSSLLNALESELKNTLLENIHRGSFEISINYKRLKVEDASFRMDEEKIKSFVEQLNGFASLNGQAVEYKATDFLRTEFQQDIDQEEFSKELYPLVLDAFRESVKNLLDVRQSEGEKIKSTLLDYVSKYSNEFKQVTALKENYREDVEQRLREKLKGFKEEIKIDDQRLLQEVIYYLEKLDINEEIDRINYHLSSLQELLNSKKTEVGRKVDFLLQELNRETNTIGSKSGVKEISNHVVNMKSFLEKIREQGLNLQ